MPTAALLLLLVGAPAEVPDFALEVRPLLSRRCFACHGPDDEHRAAGLRLDRREDALAPRSEGPAVVPGQPAASLLMARVRASGPERMPPPETGHGLEPDEVELLERWIADGAPYARHWSFVPPRRPEPPAVRDRDWPRSDLDRFVLARLEREGLAPSPEADRRTLLRRLSLDLVGLPPTPEELAAFLADEEPLAYERQVERLLASPRFGERWAQVWLDLARYADSSGYGSDPLREIWRYRDWVIEALDANLPLDEFTRLQLAGDLIPGAGMEERLATAFHRNTMTNTEGGTDDEEFRVAAVKDRVNTTLSVWMGLTAGCAQCHNHKFDPLTQREYYRLFDFFNHTADSDRNDDHPRLATPTAVQQHELARLDEALARVAAELEREDDELRGARDAWERELAGALEVPPVLEVRGARHRRLEDGSLLLEAADPGPVTTTLELELERPTPRALRLEALAHGDLPGGGPGTSPGNGNFVLNELRLLAPAPDAGPVRARSLRIELPGEARILSLAEVELFSGGRRVSVGARARQSSTDFGGDAQRAVDGDPDGRYERGSVTHTRSESDPWFELELEQEELLERVVVHNRIDGDLERRLHGALLSLRDGAGQVLWSTALVHPGERVEFVPGRDPARLLLRRPRADHAQTGFGVEEAVDGSEAPDSGWAVAPLQGRDHQATFELVVPPGALERSGGRLRVELAQTYGQGHALGRLRLSFSEREELLSLPPGFVFPDGDARAVDRTAMDVRAAEAALEQAFRASTPLLAGERARRDALLAERERIVVPTTPVMEELPPDRRRTTHVLLKGNFLTPGEQVHAGVPEALHPWPEGAPLDRRGLADWLVSRENPLTARVFVNRTWSRLFGRGIVETEEDFGSQGSPPSHPLLLDWLAVEFMDLGWDRKALLRTLVTSATYRQDSTVRAELLHRDPRNVLLARGPRVRLPAETVRDQALALAGLLVHRRGGPSVYPPQPEGLWQAAFNGQRTWPTSEGEDRWRRGVYVFLRRTIPYPSLATFDAPSRELCTLRRIPTSTPLQALVTLNDPVYVEAAQALARRIVREVREGGPDLVRRRAAHGFELCTAHEPAREELEALVELVETLSGELAPDGDEALALATDPLGPLPPELAGRELELATWTQVAGVLLNLDAVLVKD